MKVCLHNRVCVLCLVTLLLHPCCPSHSHKGHSHHGHSHEGHVHDGPQKSQEAGPSMTTPQGPLMTDAVSEQRFYIQKLFHRYGQRDRLDFKGFQSLLMSLGLGQVRLLGLEHDDLGHDHVAHLDVLEVQEGYHTHSVPHPHNQPQPEPEQEHAYPTAESSPCQAKDAGVTGSPLTEQEDENKNRYSNELEDDNHHHRHGSSDEIKEPQEHEHQQKHLEDVVEQDPAGGHAEKTEPPHSGRQPLPESQPSDAKASRPRRPSKSKGHQNKTRGSSPVPLAGGHGGQDILSSTGHELKPGVAQGHDPPPKGKDFNQGHDDGHDHEHRHMNDSILALNPGHGDKEDLKHERKLNHDHKHNHEHSHNASHDHDHDHDEDHSQDNEHAQRHMGKRAAPGGSANPVWSIQANHPENLEHQHEECLNLTQLLHYYGLSADSLISPTQFSYLCPALLYQIDSRVCIRHYHHVDVHHSALEPTHSVWTWVWGFVSITIISLLSLLGVVLVPIVNQSCFKFLLTFLVALAVGTLSGDAVLHLLPHSQGEHDHGESGAEEQEEDLLTAFDAVWKGLSALAGIYLLFIIEHCIGMFKHYKDQKGNWCSSKRKMDEANIGRKLSDHHMNRRSDGEWMHLKALTAPGSDGSVCDGKSSDAQAEQSDLASPSHHSEPSPVSEGGKKAKTKKHSHSHGHLFGHSHGHSHQGHCHSDQEMKDAGIASIAWMVIMGDGMHNFSDGLAIGAAFSANVTGGISTSVAVFCHELPHELGDFAVLLKAGMSVKQAIVYNLLSALMAYVGMMIGTAVGQYTHNVTSWIFAITAGMFLYVALVDMLPEMLHGDSEDHKRCELGHFLLQNLGLLSGFGIMLLIAIFEERIVLDLSF